MSAKFSSCLFAVSIYFSAAWVPAQTTASQTPTPVIDLPSSKQLIGEIPGHPQRINSLPISMAVSPGRPLRGHGECRLRNLRVASTISPSRCSTRRPARWPIFPMRGRACVRSRRSTPDWPSAATAATSTSAWPRSPTRRAKAGRYGQRHRGLQFADGKIAPERLIPLPVAQLPQGRKTRLPGGQRAARACPIPSAIAVVGAAGREKLLVAENLSDDAVLLDAATGVNRRNASISLKAMPCPRPIPSRSPSRKTASAPSSRCGTRRRLSELDLDQRHGRPQTGPAQALQPRSRRNPSLRLRVLAGRKDALRRAGQSRRRCRRRISAAGSLP